MIKWRKTSTYFESECGNYRIDNKGERGGDRYCLWTRKPDVFCVMLSMGTYKEVREKANLIGE